MEGLDPAVRIQDSAGRGEIFCGLLRSVHFFIISVRHRLSPDSCGCRLGNSLPPAPRFQQRERFVRAAVVLDEVLEGKAWSLELGAWSLELGAWSGRDPDDAMEGLPASGPAPGSTLNAAWSATDARQSRSQFAWLKLGVMMEKRMRGKAERSKILK
jgi:hypothetical protein